MALLFATSSLQAAEVVAFREDFETDGTNTRYTLENPSDDGANAYFARRLDLSNGTRTTGGTLSGSYFWAGRDIDKLGTSVNGMDSDEGRITFNAFSIAGLGNMTIYLEAAQGSNEFEADNVFLVDVKVDGGEWKTIGGFRGTGTDSPGRYFVGDENTNASLNDARLTNNFATFSWPLSVVGTTMQIRIKLNLNGATEEYAFDNVRVVADNALAVASLSLPASSFNEGDSTTLTLTLASPAPEGGITLPLVSSDTTEVILQASATIPAGETSVLVPVTIVADNTYDGDQNVTISLSGTGVARNSIALKVINVDRKPSIILNEFMTSVPGSLETDLKGDANNDGIRNGSQDEFLEFVNNDTIDINLSGWTISDDKGVRHIFPEGTILKSGRAIVIFAGGKPRGLFGGAIVQTATAGNFGYGDTGDIIVLASGGADVISYDYTSTFPSVYMGVTRNPDITGTYTTYNNVSRNGELFSPGTKIDGSPFGNFSNTLHLSFNKSSVDENDANPVIATVSLSSPAPSGGLAVTIQTDGLNLDGTPNEVYLPHTTVTIPEGQSSTTFEIYAYNDLVLDGDRTVTFFVRNDDSVPAQALLTVKDVAVDNFDVVINEAFGSVTGTGLDTNGNGVQEEAINDQFIELVNNSGRMVDLTGWKLYSYGKNDTNGQVCVHVFPVGTILKDQGAIVIFGGGNQTTIQANAATLTKGAFAQVSNSGGVGVNLTIKDDGIIRLENPYGYTIDEVLFVSAQSNQGQSITRSPDITGTGFNTLHVPASGLNFLSASPGAKVNGTAFSGNGIPKQSYYGSVFNDYYMFDQNYFFSDVFGWTYVSSWPYLYSFDFNKWVYVSEEASKANEVYFYNYTNNTWYYTSQTLYPWAWDMSLNNWTLIY